MLRKRKGLNFVAEAISKISTKNQVKVIVTGIPKTQEESQIYNDFKKRLGSIEIIKHERFSDEEMPVLYNIADVTILCSEAEGYGTVLLEAMACQCPVIGSDVMGINEVVKDNYNGILCKYGDVDALGKAIIKIISNRGVRNKFVKNSLSVLKTKYSLKKQAQSHIRLYNQVRHKQAQQVTCVLFRRIKNREEVYLVSTDKSYSLPKGSKDLNESWLQTAIKKVRKDIGYMIMIPSHLINISPDGNQPTYSFEITTDTSFTNDGGVSSGRWLDIDKAILQIKDKNDKQTLENMKLKL